MQRFRNILVGVDLTSGDRLASEHLCSPTRTAVDRAIALAERTSARLTFFTAIEISVHAHELLDHDPSSATETVRQAAHAVLQGLVDEANERGVEATFHLAWGRDWLEIIRQVIRGEHDLVIVGASRHGAAGRLLFGSAGMKLFRKCPTPVWIPKTEPHPQITNILVASDLSEVAQDALDLTVSGGQLVDARIVLLHAIESAKFDPHVAQMGIADEALEEHHQKLVQRAEETLREQLARTDHHTLTRPVEIEVVDGPAEKAVLEAIDRHEIDLLVMGTIAKGGIAGLLLGSTAEHLLPRVPCSALVIKPNDFVSPVTLDD